GVPGDDEFVFSYLMRLQHCHERLRGVLMLPKLCSAVDIDAVQSPVVVHDDLADASKGVQLRRGVAEFAARERPRSFSRLCLIGYQANVATGENHDQAVDHQW